MGGAAAGPRVIISLLLSGVQVVGRGGGGDRRVFRGRGAALKAAALRNFPLPSVSEYSDGGRGRTDAPINGSTFSAVNNPSHLNISVYRMVHNKNSSDLSSGGPPMSKSAEIFM